MRKCAVELIVRFCADGHKIASICDALEEKQVKLELKSISHFVLVQLHLVQPALKQLQNLQSSSQNEREEGEDVLEARDFLSTLYLRALTHKRCQRFVIATLLQFVHDFQEDTKVVEEKLSVLYEGFLSAVQEVIVFVRYALLLELLYSSFLCRMHEDKTLEDFLKASAVLLTKLCMKNGEMYYF